MKHLALLIIVILAVINSVSAVTAKEDLSLTKQQKQTLEKFKKRVTPVLKLDYMKQDTYLIRWLRARNFDIGRAEDMLITSLKWRKDNQMDTIHEEDWSVFQNEYPYDMIEDREGRPVIIFHLGSWDIRKAAVAGQIKKLVRYYAKILDEATLKLIDLQRQGKIATRWSNVFDLNKINADQHLAVNCFPFYTGAVVSYEQNFPGLVDKLALVNSPAIFEAVLTLVRPVMTGDTRQALVVYGKNRQDWETKLKVWVDPAKLTV